MYKATAEAIRRYAQTLNQELDELDTVNSLINRRVRSITRSAASGEMVSINQMALIIRDTQAFHLDYETVYSLVHYGFIVMSPTIETPYNHKIKQHRESVLPTRYKSSICDDDELADKKVWVRDSVEYGKNTIYVIYPADYMIEIEGKNHYVNFPKKEYDLSHLLYGHFNTWRQEVLPTQELYKWVSLRINRGYNIIKDRPVYLNIQAVDYLKLTTLIKHFFTMAEYYAVNYNMLKDEFTQALYKRLREHI